MDYLEQHIESLIFATDAPITYKEISATLTEAFGVKLHKKEITTALEALKEKYTDDQYSFEVVEIADGYQFLTKGSYHQTIGVHLKQTTKKRLSQAAIETLSIIAYKQPVTKTELEQIRGVSCDYTIKKLLEKELVSITGRSDNPGRPLLYGTSEKFMDYFGIKNIDHLPTPKEFKQPENSIGAAPEIEE